MQDQLTAEIARIRATIPTSGEVGIGIEEHIRRALSEVLPRKVGVSHGFVIDSTGGESKQMDIILYDSNATPHILVSSDLLGHRVFPVESTYACGEVKTILNVSALGDTFAKCASYKTLVRQAYYRIDEPIVHSYKMFGQESNHWQSIFFCIAVEGKDFLSLARDFSDIVREGVIPLSRRPDTIVALDTRSGKHNMLVNAEVESRTEVGDVIPRDGGVDLIPSATSEAAAFRAKEPWALFIHLLLRYASLAPSEPIDMVKYAAGGSF